jgi:hypothetical protein
MWGRREGSRHCQDAICERGEAGANLVNGLWLWTAAFSPAISDSMCFQIMLLAQEA